MLYQVEHGHRMTSDDLVGAACAVSHLKSIGVAPSTYLDIGTGLGSVLSLVNCVYHGKLKKSFGIEAQSLHVKLARKTLKINGCEDVCEIIHQDLRKLVDNPYLIPAMKFALITGTPPYFPATNGPVPLSSNRGMCAFELRGGVELYCEMASKFLEKGSDSRFVVVNTSLEITRTQSAASALGLQLVERWDVHGIVTKPSLFSVFVYKWASDVPAEPTIKQVNIRGHDGQFTSEMKEILRLTGKPPPDYEPQTQPKCSA
jgi:tRNA1Val (adenine37-N6)-methyltransferase